MRINRFVATMLGVSRRQADKLIQLDKITVNDSLATPGMDIADQDIVKNNGQVINHKINYSYLLLNKPVGYVCSRRGQGNKTIYDLLPKQYQNLKNVGRLDKDSSGLVLLTDDGKWHFELTHPSHQKLKIYRLKLNQDLAQTDITRLATSGVVLDDGISKFKVTRQDGDILIHIYEGRNRQIRRTFAKLGYQVTELHRLQFGPYSLKDLPSGQWMLIDK